MAPVEVQAPVSLIPVAIVGSHVFLVVYLYVVVLRTIFRSYLALGPSSATRSCEPLRRGYVKIFSVLVVVSLMVGTFFALNFSSLSYRVWAMEKGVSLPESVFGDKGALRGGEHPGRLHLVRWLNDVPFYRDILEITSEQARYLWWNQQVSLALVSWSMYLAIEGRRRKIGNLWAFLALSQLVNLSFAQNLFFVAVLLTPVPLPPNFKDLTRESMPFVSTSYHRLVDNIVKTKPEAFLPHPALYITLLFTNYAAIFFAPYAANTSSFMAVTLVSKILPFFYLALPYMIPNSWAIVNSHPHAHHTSYSTLFQSISFFSALLHFKSTVNVLGYSAAVSYNHRHALLRPFTNDNPSTRNRFAVPLNRLLTAITEHPAVSAGGYDMLLSGLSLGIWAAIRGLDGNRMITSILPLAKFQQAVEEVAADVTEELTSIKEEVQEAVIKEEKPEPPATRRRGRPRKVEPEHTPEPERASVVSSAPTPRRRGRPLKQKSEPKEAIEANVSGKSANDTPYKPEAREKLEEGDEYIPEDWESAALAWGMIVVSGLGVGSAGVYGAEIMNR
ncbi:hypothetical protein BGZ60DRAFT_531372 [Tricladium varicosporioides]|nr:hypothetical protein BGZ60DRAFT_531372 [Hymenoscyphus varicosporioides]